jgi:hypothetical protein
MDYEERFSSLPGGVIRGGADDFEILKEIEKWSPS